MSNARRTGLELSALSGGFPFRKFVSRRAVLLFQQKAAFVNDHELWFLVSSEREITMMYMPSSNPSLQLQDSLLESISTQERAEFSHFFYLKLFRGQISSQLVLFL